MKIQIMRAALKTPAGQPAPKSAPADDALLQTLEAALRSEPGYLGIVEAKNGKVVYACQDGKMYQRSYDTSGALAADAAVEVAMNATFTPVGGGEVPPPPSVPKSQAPKGQAPAPPAPTAASMARAPVPTQFSTPRVAALGEVPPPPDMQERFRSKVR